MELRDARLWRELDPEEETFANGRFANTRLKAVNEAGVGNVAESWIQVAGKRLLDSLGHD